MNTFNVINTYFENYYNKKNATDKYIKEYDELLTQINDKTPELEEIIKKYENDNNITEEDLKKLTSGQNLINNYDTKGMIFRMENNKKVLDKNEYDIERLAKHIYGDKLDKKKNCSVLLSKIEAIIDSKTDENDKSSPPILPSKERGGKKKSKTNKKRKNLKKHKRKSVKR